MESIDANDPDVDICELAITTNVAAVVEGETEGETTTPAAIETDSGARTILMNNIRDDLRNAIQNRGIEIIDVRLKRVELPAEITQGVFRQMIETRNQEATDKRTQGDRDAAEIRAQADRLRIEKEATARRQSEQIRGEGDAERNRIYANAYERDAEFFRFQRALIACEKAFGVVDIGDSADTESSGPRTQQEPTRIVVGPNQLGLCDEFIERARANGTARR